MEIVRLKDVAVINSCTSSSLIGEVVDYLPMQAVTETGEYKPQLSEKEKLPSGLNNFSSGDLLLAKISPCFENGKAALITNLETGYGMGSSELMPIKPVLINPMFLKYLTSSPEFINAGIHDYKGATGHQRITPRFVEEYTFDSTIDQDAVVEILDSKTRIINEKIKALKHKLHHLEEYKTALIHNAVTKGLDAKGKRILDGTPVRYYRMKDLFSNRSVNGFYDKDLLSATQAMGVVPNKSLPKRVMTATKNLEQFKLVQNGDFVVSLRSFEGGIELSLYEGVISPAYTVIRPNNLVYQDYFRHLLKSHDFIATLNEFKKGIRDGQAIPYTQLKDVLIRVPCIPEQVAVATYVSEKLNEVGGIYESINKKIALLVEYKKSLINEAVSGEVV